MMINLRKVLFLVLFRPLRSIKSSSVTPNHVINRVFTRHGHTQMVSICDALIDYSKGMIEECSGSDKRMFQLMLDQL